MHNKLKDVRTSQCDDIKMVCLLATHECDTNQHTHKKYLKSNWREKTYKKSIPSVSNF